MKLKNKVMSSITALAAAMVMMAGMTIPAYANIDQAAADAAEAEAETETVIEETQPYYSGSVTLEQAVSYINDRVTKYVREK